MLSLSQIFKSAHALTKQIIKSGDSYSATFALVLKRIHAILNEFKSALVNAHGVSKNGSRFIEIEANNQWEADALVGSVVKSRLPVIGGTVNPRRGTFNPFQGGVIEVLNVQKVGSVFRKDNILKVRLYGEFTKQEEWVIAN